MSDTDYSKSTWSPTLYIYIYIYNFFSINKMKDLFFKDRANNGISWKII